MCVLNIVALHFNGIVKLKVKKIGLLLFFNIDYIIFHVMSRSKGIILKYFIGVAYQFDVFIPWFLISHEKH